MKKNNKGHAGNRMAGASIVPWNYIEKIVLDNNMSYSELSRRDGRGESYYMQSSHVKRGSKLPKAALRYLNAMERGELIPEPVDNPNWENIKNLAKKENVKLCRLSRLCGLSAQLRTIKHYTAGLVLIITDTLKCTRDDLVSDEDPEEGMPMPLFPIPTPPAPQSPVQMSIEDIEEDDFEDEPKKPGRKADPDTPQIRFTARFSDLEWAYLSEKHWVERTYVNDIIREYVKNDMMNHPEIMKNIK